MRYEACRLFDAHLPCGAQANMAKLLAADASWEAANACLQFHGGFGFASEYDVERKFRETRLYQVAPISTNLILSLRRRARAGPAALLLITPMRTGRTAFAAPDRLNMPRRSHPRATLATFASGLRFEQIPAHVVRRTEDFLARLVRVGAGRTQRARGTSLARFACDHGTVPARPSVPPSS